MNHRVRRSSLATMRAEPAPASSAAEPAATSGRKSLSPLKPASVWTATRGSPRRLHSARLPSPRIPGRFLSRLAPQSFAFKRIPPAWKTLAGMAISSSSMGFSTAGQAGQTVTNRGLASTVSAPGIRRVGDNYGRPKFRPIPLPCWTPNCAPSCRSLSQRRRRR